MNSLIFTLFTLFTLLTLMRVIVTTCGDCEDSKCFEETAKNIPNGTITVNSNQGWTIGGWGFASLFNFQNFGGYQFNWGSGNFGFGNFGDDNQGKGNFGEGNLGDSNFGNWNVGRGNCGNYNFGSENRGNWNVGRFNVGSYNLGHGNDGSGNTGSSNSGQFNVGISNEGNDNIGLNNVGSFNLGINNSGIQNIGWNNTGSWNSGTGNVGIGNAGALNLGNFSIGYLNEGTNNTGALNYGVGNVGYLGGVESVTISGLQTGTQANLIPWTGLTINTINVNLGQNTTGWSNINSTNVGIGQSGFRNLGYDNVGTSNIGFDLSGNQNTGGRLTGDDLIGYDQNTGSGSNFTPVTINGISDESILLESRVSGLMQDLVITPYPSVFASATSKPLLVAPKIPSDCPTFTPISITNSFSISLRCRGSLKITDLYCSGDSFDIYKNGKLWMSTPVVPLGKCAKIVVDPDEAFNDSNFSHVQVWLPAGSYTISVVGKVTALGGGAVAVKVDDFCDRIGIGSYIPF